MKFHDVIVAVAGLAWPLLASQTQAAEIKVLASTAVKTTLETLGPQFEKATGNKVDLTFAPASVLKEKIDQGTAFDVAILTTPIIDGLVASAKIESAHTSIAHSGIGVAIRKGAAKPDVGTREAFTQALLKANSVGYTAGGATGAYLKVLFERLGIADALKPKLKLLQGGVGEAVTTGEVEIGMTQISEILPYAGAELVGPLPKEIQLTTSFATAVGAGARQAEPATALIRFLTGPAAAAVFKAKGLDPAG
jgi:molybdate transport system substrate-binding protein